MTNDELYYEYFENNEHKKLKDLLQSKVKFISVNFRFDLRRASRGGQFAIFKTILEHSNIDPSCDENCFIRFADMFDHSSIIYFLWKYKKVKNTLQKDKTELYSELIKKDNLIKSINNF